MRQLLLGTRNVGKTAELKSILCDIEGLELLTCADRSFSEVAETGETFLENALLKARGILTETGLPVLAEDAGLEVAALAGAPGVRSARFAGIPVDYGANNRLLLERLAEVEDRRARFVTVAALVLPDERVFVTTGVLEGAIGDRPIGEGGFGYDPLFVPDGESRTLAQLTLDEKNQISHRMRAMRLMLPILRELSDRPS